MPRHRRPVDRRNALARGHLQRGGGAAVASDRAELPKLRQVPGSITDCRICIELRRSNAYPRLRTLLHEDRA